MWAISSNVDSRKITMTVATVKFGSMGNNENKDVSHGKDTVSANSVPSATIPCRRGL